jgi:hypothetical protein
MSGLPSEPLLLVSLDNNKNAPMIFLGSALHESQDIRISRIIAHLSTRTTMLLEKTKQTQSMVLPQWL